MKLASFNALLFACLCIVGISAIADPVSPKVKVSVEKMIDPLKLNNSWSIAVDATDSEMMFNAEYLRDSLQEEFNLDIEIGSYENGRKVLHTKKTIVLGKTSNPHIIDLIEVKQLVVDSRIGTEGYVIESFEEPGILVVANESAGIFYGIQSLLRQTPGTDTPFQLLYTDSGMVKLDGLYIADWPDKPVRGVYINRDRCTNLTSSNQKSCLNQDLIGLVGKMARWKINYLAVGGRVPSKWLGDYENLPALYDRAKDHYITPMPVLNGLASPVDLIRTHPHNIEGVPVSKEGFRFVDDGTGRIVLTPEKEVLESDKLRNGGFEMPVTTLIPDDSQEWFFTPRAVCPTDQPFCSDAEKETINHWEWATNESPDDNNTHSGDGAVKCTVTQSWAEEHPTEFSSTFSLKSTSFIPVEGGKTYTVSFWAKGEEIVGGSPAVVFIQRDANGKTVAGTNQGVNSAALKRGNFDWRQYFASIRTAEDTDFIAIVSQFGRGGHGSFSLDDFEVRRMDGALVNVIRSPNSDIVITSQDGLTTYEENTDYKIIDGEHESVTITIDGITYASYPLSRPTQIELLPGSAISEEQHVNLQYDFSLKLRQSANTGFHTMNYSINEPTTYTSYMCPYVEDMMTELSSDYVFYRGADEVRGINRDLRNGDMENYELIAKDINKVFECVKQVNPDARMFLWGDMFNPWHNGNNKYYQSAYGGKIGAIEPVSPYQSRATDLIPRADLIPAIWYYSAGDQPRILENSPAYFENRGFEWIASPSFNGMNIQEWASAITDRQMNLGMIDTTWWNYEGIQRTANHVWNNKQVTLNLQQETDGPNLQGDQP